MVSGISQHNNWHVENLAATAANDNVAQAPAKESGKAAPAAPGDILEKSAEKPANKAGTDVTIPLPEAKADKTAVAKPNASLYDVTIMSAARPALSAELLTGAEWQALTSSQKAFLENSAAFASLALETQKSLVSIAGNIDAAAFAAAMKMLDFAEPLTAEANEQLVAAFINASGAPEVAKELTNLLKTKEFCAAKEDTKIALLAQCKNFPNAHSIKHLVKLSSAKWFKKMDLPDQQRAAKSIAYMAEVSIKKPGSEQNTLLDNTMNRLLSGEIPLHFTEIEDDPGSITFGYAPAFGSGIYINNQFVPAGNDPYPKDNLYARHAVLDTIPHEVSHQVNGDKNRSNYKYFQAEYRAWYVGWIAENGTPPTRQWAYLRCLELFELYPSIDSARTGTWFWKWTDSDARKIIEFVQQFSEGTDLDLKDPESAKKILELKVTNPRDPAPLPDPALNHDLDN